MKTLALVFAFVAAPVAASAAPASHAMGSWDCSGSKPAAVTIDPGEHVYVWRGECSGAEGWDVVLDPVPPGLERKLRYDAATKELRLWVRNPDKAAVKTKMHVFVGFA